MILHLFIYFCELLSELFVYIVSICYFLLYENQHVIKVTRLNYTFYSA